MKRESFEMQNLSSNYVCPAVIVGIDRCAKQICSRTVIKTGVNEDDLTLYRSASLSIGFRSFSFSIVSKRRDKNLIKSAAGRECFRRLAARIVRREYYFFFFLFFFFNSISNGDRRDRKSPNREGSASRIPIPASKNNQLRLQKKEERKKKKKNTEIDSRVPSGEISRSRYLFVSTVNRMRIY